LDFDFLKLFSYNALSYYYSQELFMPIFEYICQSCGHKFEVLNLTTAKTSVKCPDCRSEKVEKQLSVFNAAVKEGQSKKCHSCSDHSCPHSGH
jgi:putative FmdB family regulatory protein